MKRSSRYVSLISVALGLALLGYLLRRAGVNTVVEAMRVMGKAFLVILILSGLRQCLRTVAWRLCLDRGVPSSTFWNLLSLRLIGESATDLSPAGPFLGETVRAWAAARTMPATVGVASVVIEDTAYSLGTALFVLAGSVPLIAPVMSGRSLGIGSVSILLILVVILAILSQQSDAFGSFILHLKQTTHGQKFVARYGHAFSDWTARIQGFFQNRKKLLLSVLCMEILTNLISLAETYLILNVTTAHASLVSAYLVESANRCAQLVSWFVPFGLGVDEATTTATLRSLGHTLREGVSAAVVRKIRVVFWDLVGLALAVHFAYARRSQEKAFKSFRPNQTAHLVRNLEVPTRRIV